MTVDEHRLKLEERPVDPSSRGARKSMRYSEQTGARVASRNTFGQTGAILPLRKAASRELCPRHLPLGANAAGRQRRPID